MAKKSRWSRFLPRIIEIIEEKRCGCSPLLTAEQINREFNLNLSMREIDLLRTYVRRKQQKMRLKLGMPKNKTIINGKPLDLSSETSNNAWDIRQDNALWEYKGSKSITTLEQALGFSEVDLNEWEVERHIFNSWDVTMKGEDGEPITKTNYQVKVWFRRKAKLELEKPVYRHIQVEKKIHSQMWVIIGCVHRPFHDKILWDKFIGFLKHNKEKITGVLIDGDFLDLRSLSSHEEWIPDGVDLSMEYSDGAQGIRDIEDALNDDIEKVYMYGNHEDRFFRDKKSIRKYGASLPSPHEAMELEEKGWEVITDWKNGYVTLGNLLDVYHGTKVGMNASKDQLNALPTRDHVFFHTHRVSSYSNQTNTAYNGGCMIDLDSDMFKYVDRGVRAAWSQGFIVAYIDDEGGNHVTQIKVRDDRHFFFEGLVY
jgi:hypothetical protein